jgi:hypothetical protein
LGFQYLHDPCDLELISSSLSEEIIQKYFSIDICSQLYSLKVYGIDSIKNSISKMIAYKKKSIIWNLRDAVDFLWGKYQFMIKERRFNSFDELSLLGSKYKIVLSSIPINFLDKTITDSEKSFVTTFHVKNSTNKVFYDIDPNSIVYRFGSMFNSFFIESIKPLNFGISTSVLKIKSLGSYKISPNDNVVLIGRYGAWNKNILVDDVYREVKDRISWI